LVETSDFLGISLNEAEEHFIRIKNKMLEQMDFVYNEQQLLDRIESLPDRIPPPPSVWQKIDSGIIDQKLETEKKKKEVPAKEEEAPVSVSETIPPEPEKKKKNQAKNGDSALSVNNIYKNKNVKKFLQYFLIVIAASILYYFFIFDRNKWIVENFSGTVTIAGNLVREGTAINDGEEIKGTANSYFSMEIMPIGKIQSSGISNIKCVSDSELTLSLGDFIVNKDKAKSILTVNIPSAVIKDNAPGGNYNVHVNPGNNSIIENNSGGIFISTSLYKFYAPSGYICEVAASVPVVPYHKDSPQLKNMLADLNSEQSNKEEIANAILTSAGQKDLFTLWNMLKLITPMARGEVFDFIAKRVQLPASISREGIIYLDEKKLEDLRNVLDAQVK
jgi:hypothetical protein